MMLTRNLAVFVLVLSSVLPGLVGVSYAGDRYHILVLGNDADPDAIPRHSRVFNRVLSELKTQLDNHGLAVYSEEALAPDHFASGKKGRTRHELVLIGKSIKNPPIDVLSSFSIFASVKEISPGNYVKVRVEGELIQVDTGRFLGAFEWDLPGKSTVPNNCSRECVIEEVGKHAQRLARDVGAILAEKLLYKERGTEVTVALEEDTDFNGEPTEYTLKFENFDAQDMLTIQEYLVVFSGYKTHRPISKTPRSAELWYLSDINAAMLDSNLNRMLMQLGLHGFVHVDKNVFTLQQTLVKKKKAAVDKGW